MLGKRRAKSQFDRTSVRRRTIPVELDLLLLSFLGHFAWEFLQAPLYSSFEGTPHLVGILTCLRATLGDLAIALGAFWVGALAGGGRDWVVCPGLWPVATFIGFGLFATIGVEHLSTEVLDRWAYGSSMPRLPLVGTGIAPLAQWMIIPPMVLWYLGRLSPAADRTSKTGPLNAASRD